jgi:hypothetical protein
MLRRGERDSWSDGSACVAVIYILGAINGTAVTVSGEPAGFPIAIDVGHDRDRPGRPAIELPPGARIGVDRSLSSLLTRAGDVGAATERPVNPGWGRETMRGNDAGSQRWQVDLGHRMSTAMSALGCASAASCSA